MSSELEEIFQKGLIAGISKYGHLLSEEPEDLRVFSSDIPGFFNRKLMLPGFDFNSQIAVNDGSAYWSNIVQNYPNNNQIIGSGDSRGRAASWFQAPFLEIDSENVMRNKVGSYRYGDVNFFIPIKRVEGITGFDYIVMNTYSDANMTIALYKNVNGALTYLTMLSAGNRPSYNKYYTYHQDLSSPIDIDYIMIQAWPMPPSLKSYWKELKLYKE